MRSNLLQRNRQALTNFCSRILDNFRSEQIQGSVDIFLAVLVENTPGAALRHTLHRWQVIKVRNRHCLAEDYTGQLYGPNRVVVCKVPNGRRTDVLAVNFPIAQVDQRTFAAEMI